MLTWLIPKILMIRQKLSSTLEQKRGVVGHGVESNTARLLRVTTYLTSLEHNRHTVPHGVECSAARSPHLMKKSSGRGNAVAVG